MGHVGVLRNHEGRMRLGWRLLLFSVLTTTIAYWTGFLFPDEMPLGATPVLLGSVLAGMALLGVEGRGPGALGFYLAPAAARETLLGVGLGTALAAGVLLVLVLTGTLRWVAAPGGMAEYFGAGGESLWLFAIPAAAEEALMRGYLFQALAESWGGPWALGVTSGVFGALHLGNPNTSWVGLANIVLAGLFLGVVYWKTASLWWATGVHLGWNWAHGFLADLPVSGLELVDAPVVEPVLSGPAWASGGAFGPEGSLAATVVLVLGTAWIWRTSRLRPGRKAMEVRPLVLVGSDQSVRPETGGAGRRDSETLGEENER